MRWSPDHSFPECNSGKHLGLQIRATRWLNEILSQQIVPLLPAFPIFARNKIQVEETLEQYQSVAASCKAIFLQKAKDYGTAWRILRPASLTDQLYIKAKRIRTIQENGRQHVEDSISTELKGIVNYSIMALIQLQLPAAESLELSAAEAAQWYDRHLNETRELMIRKNTDYGEAWRDMRLSSLVDLILMKLLRIKQIEDNQGVTLISEGVEANFHDIINYALFALIQLLEAEQTPAS